MTRPGSLVLLVLALIAAPSAALAWGFDGHRRLAQHMHEVLPANSCLRLWIAANQTAALQDSSCDPDRWRIAGSANYDAEEPPRHYLEIDRVTPVSAYPREWAAAKLQLGRYAYQNGYVPWRIEEYYTQLVALFRATPLNSAAILTHLARFSHYVTDSFSVLHATSNFDPAGLHQRWESDLLNTASYIDGISARAVTYYGTVGKAEPRMMTFDMLIVGNGLVAQLIAADQAATRDGGSYNMPGFYSSVKELTARRWGDALTLLGSFIGSAWVEAGKPKLPGTPSSCSMEMPQGAVTLKGYPMPGGWTVIDAGVPDGDGGGGGAGGGSGGGEINPGGGPGVEEPPSGCACAGTGAAGWGWPSFATALALLARRRRR